MGGCVQSMSSAIVDAGAPPPKKRPRVEEKEHESQLVTTTLELCVEQINELIGKRGMYVCWECDKLHLGEAVYLATSKWDHERSFCRKCILRCVACDEFYAPSMSYRHEDCANVVLVDSDGEEKEAEDA